LKVLILPVACPLLNPIEPMWGQQKQHIRKNNFDYTMERVRVLALEKFNTQTASDWNKQYERTLKYARLQWDADELLLDDEETIELGNGEEDVEEYD
jgi:hypothetical protein